MNDHEPPEPVEQARAMYYVLSVIVGVIVLVLYLVFGGSGTSVTQTKKSSVREDPLQIAREGLNKSGDLNTCRAALTQVNQVLGRQGPGAALRLPADQAEFVRKRFELKDDEWAEVSNDTFTLLDGHYLETALLFRDVAASFTRDGVLTSAQALPRAQAAFAWAVRQVRLQEGRDEADPLPVAYVLRRGFGTPLERALVFLELLRQFEVPGCLVTVREPGASGFPLWTCGALVGRDIYLFDPRMGIPLPGPKGAGVATLADVQKEPDLLNQLSAGDADRYDVTAEQAGKARIYLALPLSALAPRMRYLERVLQDPDVSAPVVAGRFGVDAVQLFQQFEDAQAATGARDCPAVRAWPPAARSLRAVLPADEGGLDDGKRPRWMMMRAAMIPIQSFPPIVDRNKGEVFNILFEKFSKPFIAFYFDPQQPRDLLLRGHFAEATPPLIKLRRDTMEHRARLTGNPEMADAVRAALDNVVKARAEFQIAERQAGGDPRNAAFVEARGRWEDAWKESQAWLEALIDGAAAGPLGQEVNYQLALVKHEQAERLQLRVDNPSRASQASGDESDSAGRAWQNAADCWTIYLQEYADSSNAPAARFHAYRVHSMLGDRDTAQNLLQDLSKLSDFEKVGRHFLARHLEQKK
jgi:hypothetical protein